MEHDETGFQAPPEGPILCINNCGFFGSPANMNMCSKCYKDTVSKQEQVKSIESIVNGGESSSRADVDASSTIQKAEAKKPILVSPPPSVNPSLGRAEEEEQPRAKDGPSRCTTCKKRVGLTGFKCRCGHLFCGSHRYSDKHDCPFDYRTAGKDAIAKANPVVKAEKLDNKI